MKKLRKLAEHSPVITQRLLSKTLVPYVLPFYWGGFRFLRYRNFLKNSQWWTKEKLEEYQLFRLKKIINHAYHNVPYYNELFKKNSLRPNDIKCFEDLEKIPILTKEDVVKNFYELLYKKMRKEDLKLVKTGGTTGKPLSIYYDKETIAIRNAAFTRRLGYAGIELTDKNIELGGCVTSIIEGHDLIVHDSLTNTVYISGTSISPDFLKIYLEETIKMKPKFIKGGASAIYIFANFLKEENSILDLNLRAIFTESETLFPFQKSLIEKHFNCKIFNSFSMAEDALSAFECPSHEGLHLDMEKCFIEILDLHNGKPVRKGNCGEIIATSLANYAMPIIRYKTEDIGSFRRECSCGRELTLLNHIEGRIDDFVVLEDGKVIRPPEFGLVIKGIESIKESQFIQESKNEFLIKIVKRKNYTNKDTRELIKNLYKLVGTNIKVRIEFTDFIGRTKNGKFRFVLSKVPLNF